MNFTATRGDVDTAFREAEYTRRERFSVQRHTALPLEPRGLLAEWDAAAGRLIVMGAAKVPFFNRRTLAALMGLPESKCRAHAARRPEERCGPFFTL
jgi:carbon-monoxide dehydrogenase large subunit